MDIDIHIHGHEQCILEYDNKQISIDKKIAPLIKIIWNNGIKTVGSCEGKKDGFSWITFNGLNSAIEFMNHVKIPIKRWKFRAFVTENNKLVGYHCVFNGKFVIKDYNDDMEKLTIAISFPQAHITDIIKYFQYNS
jgi:hypothetical protein